MVTGGGLQRGTWKGELTRSVFLFKSFPISVVMRHWSEHGMPSAGGRQLMYQHLLPAPLTWRAFKQLNDMASGEIT
jgi:hypothetical protein